MSPSARPFLIAALLAGALSWAPLAQAQTATPEAPANLEELQRLERSLRDLAEQAIPKTVLIKAIAGPGRQGAGSGAIISPDGYILTCTHVVEIGKTLEVTTSDGKTYQAKLLGHNKRQDYALIKIEAQGLPVFTMGDSDTVKEGDWVAALGHPGGPYRDVQPAFAAGRVRGLDMKLPVGLMQKYYNHAIMTDVPIFAGDSGGPLINAKGELIGINGAIVMINEMAFAVPMNQIKPDLAALKAGKVIEGEPPGPQAWQQMQKVISPEDYQKMTGRMFKNFGKLFGGQGGENPFGKLMDPNGPFGKLFGGGKGEMPDFGKLFGGEMPDMGELFGEDGPLGKLFGGGKGEMPDLGKLLDPDGPFGKLFGGGNGEMPDLGKLFGKDSPFGKMFGGENGEAPDMQKMMERMFGGKSPFGNGQNPFGRTPPAPRAGQGQSAYVGLKVADTADLGGLLVEAVQPKGPAAKAGVRKGDLLLSVNGKSVKSMAALQSALAGKKPGQTVTLKVLRTQFLDTELVERELQLKVVLGAR
ncbi:MAG TPA: hypothetical protein DEA08_24100 [Planctomycetes bacterium]|nr:hypothetical protein [Planctomycetota bacterium]